MAELQISSKNKRTPIQVTTAKSLWSRTKGLLGTSSLPENRSLWIHRCNTIHTCFMKYEIDCVFVDRDLKVLAIFEKVSPWRITPPVWQASSVFELAGGQVKQHGIELGDTLYVGN